MLDSAHRQFNCVEESQNAIKWWIAKLITLTCFYYTKYCLYQFPDCTTDKSYMLESFYEWIDRKCNICENNIDRGRLNAYIVENRRETNAMELLWYTYAD